MVHIQFLECAPEEKDGSPDVENLIKIRDEIGGYGKFLYLGKTHGSVWAWFRVEGLSADRRTAKKCEQVRMCRRDEVQEREKYLGNAPNLVLVPCRVDGEVRALIARA